MHSYLSHGVQRIPEISQNGMNMKENLLIAYAGIYLTCDVEECGNIVMCPLSCFHDCVDVLSVDLCGIAGDILV